MVIHFTMRTHVINQAFRFVESIWLHRRSHQIRFFFGKRPILRTLFWATISMYHAKYHAFFQNQKQYFDIQLFLFTIFTVDCVLIRCFQVKKCIYFTEFVRKCSAMNSQCEFKHNFYMVGNLMSLILLEYLKCFTVIIIWCFPTDSNIHKF